MHLRDKVKNPDAGHDMIGRRTFLGGAAGLCSCAAFGPAVRAKDLYAGCTLPNQQARNLLANNAGRFSYKADLAGSVGSGDKGFDRALARTLVRLSDMFEILPGFAFQDLDEENAFATSRDEFGNRNDGTVIFGRSLYRTIMARPENPHIGIAAVCAHEFGHILQFKTGLRNRLVGSDGRVKKLELHADFLAGYFAGRRKRETPDFPAATFASMQFAFGDDSFGSPQHHGTKQERGAAVVAGFNCSFHGKEPLSQAIEAGINHVMRA